MNLRSIRCRFGRPLIRLAVLPLAALVLLSPLSARADAPSVTAAIQSRLVSGVGLPKGDRDGQDLEIIGRFYETHAMAPLWISGGRPNEKAQSLLAVLGAADADGLDPRDYGVPRIAPLLERGDSADALAELELLLTQSALSFGRDLATGRLEPSRVDSELYVEKPVLDSALLLQQLANNADPAAVLLPLAPSRPEYLALREALVLYRGLAKNGGWQPVPEAEQSLRPGEKDARLPALRSRLRITGELLMTAPIPEDPELYDEAAAVAVKLFQARHGLEPDGVVGKQTILALNVPAEQRAGQIMMNMERWRWMPRDLGQSYLLVNLAAFGLSMFDHGKVVHEARVVVGTTSTRTPVFSRNMTYMEVNPYWHVPYKIVRDEIMPKVRQDPDYLAKHGYELLPGNGVRQKPGPQNSLGRIKMMFPNEFDIYLHDTPSKALFNRARRSFSHGCIRVEHPFDVAETILRLTGTTDWDRPKLDAALESGQRTVVRLKRPIPVYISYFTAFVAADGKVNFRSDIYGRDRKLANAMHAAGMRWDGVAAEARTASTAAGGAAPMISPSAPAPNGGNGTPAAGSGNPTP
ncbi:L,D-transpeptidase family protein [Niveispirillum irakense]|uniref:L,D-transpeptidase family protein n=1 Tax=Niveispirillum irakense TaxID=34011 RepID=UPI0003FC7A06|nr:L,D-transpeptidase family protein [Niveispirillum irakense]